MSKRHKHADQIIFWVNNQDSTVYFREEGSKKWDFATKPLNMSWDKGYEYVVVPPRYGHLWDAYLENKLEYQCDSNWCLVNTIPNFHYHSPSSYRVKPDPELTVIVKVDNVGVLLKDISKETLIKAWEAAQ